MTLRNIDCFEELKRLKDKSISLIVSDAPYGISFDASSHMESSGWDKMSKDGYIDLMTRYLKEAKRVLTDNGSCWIFFAPSMLKELIDAIDSSGLLPHFDQWKSICRQKGRGAKHKLKSQREDFMLLTKSEDYILKHKDDLFKYKENTTNILNYYTGEVERPEFKYDDVIYSFKMPYYLSKTEKQIHSCQKSILLLYALIMNSSNEGDTVFDGFAGSGSCAIAAKLAGRHFIGAELDKGMHEKATKWISSFDYDSYKKTFLAGSTFGRVRV